MQLTANSEQSNLEAILERIFSNRRITRQDQNTMMANLLAKDGLSEQNIRQINQVFDALKRGIIKVVD
ncbi:hypothetical protein [Anabaena sp. UHCC 0451]|uniref:hypothetical protein n=1 Tax=Anabaena sp. UHCC 0451 TaxID=2055235 RepID=UPI002B20A2D8|nr:hypothetical protein [Anabaena sp. UHCC 0451]MEA5578984.1 hypothetical protein [Anabaena sp. UHCC 0451]